MTDDVTVADDTGHMVEKAVRGRSGKGNRETELPPSPVGVLGSDKG